MAPDYQNITITGCRINGKGIKTFLDVGGCWKELNCGISGLTFTREYLEIEKYIINDGATILFWNDDTKTISKRSKKDKFDKEIGFLFAYFYKKYNGSKASMKRVIDTIDYKKIKTFLFEFYVNDSGQEPEKARKFLSNLKVENK